MAGLAISIDRDNAVPAFDGAANHSACTCTVAAPRRAKPTAVRKTAELMTTKSKPPSGQEGFFWKTKTLEEMSDAEWESLCDGCARCCLEKLEDEDTGKIYFTHVSCKLLDAGLCACKDYANRSDLVPNCVRLTPENVRSLNWLPPRCGSQR